MNEPGRERQDWRAAARGLSVEGSCPSEERLVIFYRGQLDRTEENSLREHLSRCTKCLDVAQDARGFLEAMSLTPAGVTRPGRPRPLVWGAGLAAVAALLLLSVLGLFRGSGLPGKGAPELTFEVPPAPFTSSGASDEGLVFREGASAGELGAAMTSYVAGNFAAAERDLERYVAHRPGDERGRFYLGVTRLLNGRSADAMRELSQVARTAQEPLGSDARYYLALAALRAGDENQATEILRHLSVQEGPRRAAAAELLGRLLQK